MYPAALTSCWVRSQTAVVTKRQGGRWARRVPTDKSWGRAKEGQSGVTIEDHPVTALLQSPHSPSSNISSGLQAGLEVFELENEAFSTSFETEVYRLHLGVNTQKHKKYRSNLIEMARES